MKLLSVPSDYCFTTWDVDDLIEAAYYGGKTRVFLMDAELEHPDSAMFKCNLDIAVLNARDAARAALRLLANITGEPAPSRPCRRRR